ncbi:MAG TPA: dTDP-4-dehydrorhamnose 3,5-epimerase family protein [Roseiarcus sp.]|nr:dTDP-4-dehydrorhamnose 3,5-epimerase family protein [Roseiarcus sp.]
MKFERTELPGVVRVVPEPISDERGFFARLFCPSEFAEAGCAFAPAQMSLSRNRAAHTLRGLHFQSPPFAEAKLVRAVRGSVYDVVVDLRPESPTYRRWTAAILSAENGEALLVPEGCAHGFLTLENETDVLYQIDRLYTPGHARGVRYDDAALKVAWPAAPRVIAPADLAWPPLEG